MFLKLLAGAAVGSFVFSEYLFKLAFKRVNEVPETSPENRSMLLATGCLLIGLNMLTKNIGLFR